MNKIRGIQPEIKTVEQNYAQKNHRPVLTPRGITFFQKAGSNGAIELIPLGPPRTSDSGKIPRSEALKKLGKIRGAPLTSLDSQKTSDSGKNPLSKINTGRVEKKSRTQLNKTLRRDGSS